METWHFLLSSSSSFLRQQQQQKSEEKRKTKRVQWRCCMGMWEREHAKPPNASFLSQPQRHQIYTTSCYYWNVGETLISKLFMLTIYSRFVQLHELNVFDLCVCVYACGRAPVFAEWILCVYIKMCVCVCALVGWLVWVRESTHSPALLLLPHISRLLYSIERKKEEKKEWTEEDGENNSTRGTRKGISTFIISVISYYTCNAHSTANTQTHTHTAMKPGQYKYIEIYRFWCIFICAIALDRYYYYVCVSGGGWVRVCTVYNAIN